MVLTAIAVALGVVLGLLRGGRIAALLAASVRWWPVLGLGLALQVAAEHALLPGRLGLLVAGLFLLLVGAVRNSSTLPGSGVVAVGLAANLAVLVANGHVPVRWEALVQTGALVPEQRDLVRPGGLYQVETEGTRLALLGDIIAVPVVDEVVSFGDLILLAGVATVTANTLLRRRPDGVSPEDLFDDLDVDAPLPAPSPRAEPSAVIDLREPLPGWSERPEPSGAGR